ncbi:hypothetical protein K449DRAFT_436789 [Hypoxylon sp. EC38]|nr:hypothetical protein K449DRAFT_436789 [Hypoxylon sp. EC38]
MIASIRGKTREGELQRTCYSIATVAVRSSPRVNDWLPRLARRVSAFYPRYAILSTKQVDDEFALTTARGCDAVWAKQAVLVGPGARPIVLPTPTVLTVTPSGPAFMRPVAHKIDHIPLLVRSEGDERTDSGLMEKTNINCTCLGLPSARHVRQLGTPKAKRGYISAQRDRKSGRDGKFVMNRPIFKMIPSLACPGVPIQRLAGCDYLQLHGEQGTVWLHRPHATCDITFDHQDPDN